MDNRTTENEQGLRGDTTEFILNEPAQDGLIPEVTSLEAIAGELDGDFTAQPLARDPMNVVEDAETVYFPPTDPPMRINERGDAEFLGGFSPTADASVRVQRSASDGQPGDEAINDAVRRELREDALTSDLQILVAVREGVVHLRGTVRDLEDAEHAEEVAARVPGVVEVIEELDVAEV